MAERKKRTAKVYVDSEGNESRSWKPGVVALRFDFFADDEETVVESLTTKPSDYSEDMREAFCFHGISQKYGDSYASALKSGVDPVESVSDIHSRILEGTWVERATDAGPRTSQLIEAIIRTIESAGGVVDDERRKRIAESLQDETQRKTAQATPAIAANLKDIQAEAAAARAEKARVAAAEDDTDVSAMFA